MSRSQSDNSEPGWLTQALSFLPSQLLAMIVTLPFAKRPFQRLDQPEYYGVEHAKQFKIKVNESETDYIGAWLMAPTHARDGTHLEDTSLEKDNVSLGW